MDFQTDVNIIRPDIRRFQNSDDMAGTCRKCGRPLVMLPDDMRMGYCYDCLDLLWTSRRQDAASGRVFAIPHDMARPVMPGTDIGEF